MVLSRDRKWGLRIMLTLKTDFRLSLHQKIQSGKIERRPKTIATVRIFIYQLRKLYGR
jgi:hypothetical protein